MILMGDNGGFGGTGGISNALGGISAPSVYWGGPSV